MESQSHKGEKGPVVNFVGVHGDVEEPAKPGQPSAYLFVGGWEKREQSGHRTGFGASQQEGHFQLLHFLLWHPGGPNRRLQQRRLIQNLRLPLNPRCPDLTAGNFYSRKGMPIALF